MHKEAKDMNLDELRLLLEIRKLELKNALREIQYKMEIGTKIFRAIQKSGIVEEFQKLFQSSRSSSKKQKSTPSRKQSPSS